MVPGVYIGNSNTGSYELISTGDFVNPVQSTFKLKDARSSIIKEEDLYLIINDADIEFIQLTITGKTTAIRVFLSWEGTEWASSIKIDEQIDATNTVIIRPFKIRFIVDDFLEYFNITQQSSYKQYKIKLVYT